MKLAASCVVICLVYALTGPSLCAEHGKHLRRHLKTQRYALDWHERSSRSTDSCPEEDDLSEVVECPSGWIKYCTSCYYIRGGQKNWEAAKTDCKGRASDLITINNEAEAIFADGLFSDYTSVWLGLNDIKNEDKFVWISSGKKTSFTDWLSDPADSPPAYDCVYNIVGLGWLTQDCKNIYKYICEQPLKHDTR